MKPSSLERLLFTFAICFALMPFQTARSMAAESKTPRNGPSTFRIYGGGAIGYGNASGQDYSKAADGPQYLLDADLSYLDSSWVGDLGVGWIDSKLQGAIQDGTSVDVSTRAGFFDASLRYRIGRHWQIGPAYNLLFGTDTSFAPVIRSNGTSSLLGGRLVYEFGLADRIPFRIIGQGLTLLGGSGINYTLASVGFQIGLPLLSSSSSSSSSSPGQADQVTTESSAELRREPTNEVLVSIDPQKVFFDTNSFRIHPAVRKVLVGIGSYLARNGQKWGSIRLSGNADQRGTADYNMKLSRRRAYAVLRALAAGGVKASRISAEYFGFTKPVDPHNNPVAWAKNRRVELIVSNVKNPQALKAKLEQLAVFHFDPNH